MNISGAGIVQSRGAGHLASSGYGGLTMHFNDKMIFSTNGMGFHISNEAASDINTFQIELYTSKLEELLVAARQVKNQNFFGNIDVSTLAKDYPFVPFGYQIDNVNAMLNRFEGRGVFGDQVGLGKTVEALMTAHAMFKSGAIRNALLIVPEKTLNGWKDEINEKFPGIFKIHDCTGDFFSDELTLLKDTFNRMAINKSNKNRAENDVYIITDEMLKRNISALYDICNSANLSRYNQPISKYDQDRLDSLTRDLANIKRFSSAQDFVNILKEYGYSRNRFDTLSYNALTKKTLETVIDLLETTKKKAGATNNLIILQSQQKLLAQIDDCIKEFQRYSRRLEREYSNAMWYDLKNVLSSTVNPVANPTIDLMIIDEIHAFYESDEIVLMNPHQKLSGDSMTVTDYIARFEKKFCILLSATPIRTSLEDVFNLVYLADSKRFGNSKEAARNYFYNTVCRIPPDTKHPLNEIFNGGDEAAKNNFFGLINNFFTRKHIYDVAEQMTGATKGRLESYKQMHTDHGKAVLDLLDRDIESKLAIAFRQDAIEEKAACTYAEKLFNKWKQGADLPKIEHYNRIDKEQFLKNAVDAAIIDKLKKTGQMTIIEKDQRHWAYSNVNWNRKGKCGIALYVADDDAVFLSVTGSFPKAYKRAAKVIVLKDYLLEYFYSLPGSFPTVSAHFLLTSFEDESFKQKSPNEKGNMIKEIFPSFIAGVCYDSTLCYLSKSIERGVRNSIGSAMAEKYCLNAKNDPDFPKHKVDYYPNTSTVCVQNYNQIAIVNEKHQAGINYQHYHTFIFAQMDLNGERLLEPVDIEQWIGRIHRTGQVKDCRIVTVLTTAMTDSDRNPEDEFLKWYYEVLADPSGLDLYGNNTPDIAFLQPIIVDILRAHVNTIDENKITAALNETKLTNSKDFDQYNFAELMELYYYLGEKDYVQDTVKTLCAIEEFGKAPSEN